MAKNKIPGWLWPLGIAVAGLGSAAAVLMRGCWHRNVSWPIRYDDRYSYIVCTDCGVKRLFDEHLFHPYGPYGYEIEELIAEDRAKHIEWLRKQEARLEKAGHTATHEAPRKQETPDSTEGGGI